MKRACWFFVATALATLATLGCGAPTRPSSPPPSVASIAGAASEQATAVVPWSCMTARLPRMMGIFASGAVEETACVARPRLIVAAAAATAPGVPSNLTSSVTGGTVTLTWTAPASPDPATSYVIEAGSSAGSNDIVVFDTLSAAASFTATGVPAGSYFVRVRARNSAGASAASNEVLVIVGGGACTTAPGGLASSVNGSTVTLTWTAPAGCTPTGYVIEAGSSSGSSNLANFDTGSTATVFSAGGVANGTYYVRVRSVSNADQSASSNEITVIVGGSAPGPFGPTCPATVPGTVTGCWLGFAPDGFLIKADTGSCTLDSDLQLTLTQNGTAVTGTVTTRLRTVSRPGCDTIGRVETVTLIGGTVGSGTVSLSVPGERGRNTDLVGTFTATRMTGTIGGSAGTFAATRP